MSVRLVSVLALLSGLLAAATPAGAQPVSPEGAPANQSAPAPAPQPPAAQSPPTPTPPAGGSAPSSGSTQVPAPADPGMPATVLSPEESEGIIGKSVRSGSGEDMGRIVDVIVTTGTQPRAAVIDFGGFLGVGSRKIAVDWRLLQYSRNGRVWAVTVGLNRNQLRVSPEYKPGEPVVVLGMPAGAQPPSVATAPATVAANPAPVAQAPPQATPSASPAPPETSPPPAPDAPADPAAAPR